MLKFFKLFGAVGVLLILGAVCFGIWLKNANLTAAKLKVIRATGYPLALVNGHPVFMDDLLLRLAVAQKMQNAWPPSAAAAQIETAAYNQLVDEEKIRQIAAKNNVTISQGEIEKAYQKASAQPDFSALLAQNRISPADFKNSILRPELLLADLQIWFNSQQELNPKVYALAASLEERLKSGEDMANMARDYTEDGGKPTGGDLGFINSEAVLLELKEPVAALKTGEIKILPSRLGLHILKQEGQNGSLLHLRQIFLKITGFDSWLAEQKQNFKIWQLINTVP